MANTEPQTGKILIVDDEWTIRDDLATFDDRGLSGQEGRGRAEAIRKLDEETFDWSSPT